VEKRISLLNWDGDMGVGGSCSQDVLEASKRKTWKICQDLPTGEKKLEEEKRKSISPHSAWIVGEQVPEFEKLLIWTRYWKIDSHGS